jgi:hypothetical protein
VSIVSRLSRSRQKTAECGRLRFYVVRNPLEWHADEKRIFATAIPSPEKRSAFLERVGAMLTLRGRFDDHHVAEAAKLALIGSAQKPAA